MIILWSLTKKFRPISAIGPYFAALWAVRNQKDIFDLSGPYVS